MDSTPIVTLAAALAVGTVAGTHTATWGMYKDAPHEGFTWPKYGRSIVLSALLGPVAALATGLDAMTWSGMVVLFGLIYAIERALVEFYKTFLREEDQSKYAIPMQFAVFGRVVQGRARRWYAGAAVAATAGLLAAWTASWGEAASLPAPAVAALGSAAGWVSAIGGAWKDAPIEGFHPIKFLRSPLIAATFALALARLQPDMIVVALGALGYTVAVTETYKTFFFPSRPRGKFAGKPVSHPEYLRFRRRFVPVYMGIWILIVAAFSLAFASGAPAQEGNARVGRRRAAAGVVRVGHQVGAQHSAGPAARKEALEVGAEVTHLADPLSQARLARLHHDTVGTQLPHEGQDHGLLVQDGFHGQRTGPDVGDLAQLVTPALGDKQSQLRGEVVALASHLPVPAGGGRVVDELVDLPAPGEVGKVGERDQAAVVGPREHPAGERRRGAVAIPHPAERRVDLGRSRDGRDLPDEGRRARAVEGDHAVEKGNPGGILALAPVAAVPAARHVELDHVRSIRDAPAGRGEGREQDESEEGRRPMRHGCWAPRAAVASAGGDAETTTGAARAANRGGTV